MPETMAQAIRATLESPNESDSNFENANVVDGLFAISRSIRHLAAAIRLLSFGSDAYTIDGNPVIIPMEATPLNRIATALERLSEHSNPE